MFLSQETKLKLENSEKMLKETKKEIQFMWQHLRHMYFSLQVTKIVCDCVWNVKLHLEVTTKIMLYN